jgi:hypothetical protein
MKDKGFLVLLAVLLALFVLGVARLFQLRFEAGDVYPPYSTFRADPLGTRVFYDSLDALPGFAVQRFLQSTHRLPRGRDTTLFILGADAAGMSVLSEDEFESLEQFMFDGGRLVVSLIPVAAEPETPRPSEKAKKKEETSRKSKKNEGTDQDSGRDAGDSDKSDAEPARKKPFGDNEDQLRSKPVSLKDRWGIRFAYRDLPRNPDGGLGAVKARSRERDGVRPDEIPWHTALYFEASGANWEVRYAREQKPVIVERRFGRGELVFSADSYFLSNEAMLKERQPALLAWLAGGNSLAVFDETHLGVMENPGVAALVRRYRLHGVGIGLALLAGLFVWKNSFSFVPPPDEAVREDRGDPVSGRESAAGFVNLLRRGVASSDVLGVCLNEWKRSRAHGRPDLADRSREAEAVVAAERSKPISERDPVAAYRRVSQILSERGRRRS